jgi:hypothetical protein
MVVQSGSVRNDYTGACVGTGIGNNPQFTAPRTYAGGSKEASFTTAGTPVQGDCLTSPGKDFGLILRYTPRTLGKQSVTVTIYHDSNDQGFTTFDISGEAY